MLYKTKISEIIEISSGLSINDNDHISDSSCSPYAKKREVFKDIVSNEMKGKLSHNVFIVYNCIYLLVILDCKFSGTAKRNERRKIYFS